MLRLALMISMTLLWAAPLQAEILIHQDEMSARLIWDTRPASTRSGEQAQAMDSVLWTPRHGSIGFAYQSISNVNRHPNQQNAIADNGPFGHDGFGNDSVTADRMSFIRGARMNGFSSDQSVLEAVDSIQTAAAASVTSPKLAGFSLMATGFMLILGVPQRRTRTHDTEPFQLISVPA